MMKTELEEYFELLTETLRLFAHTAENLGDEGLSWKPAGVEGSVGALMLEACASVRVVLGKQIIEAAQPTPEDYAAPSPTRAAVAEEFQSAIAYVDWHKGKITPEMLSETRVERRGEVTEELTVRRLLLILLRHVGSRVGEARLLVKLWDSQAAPSA